MAAANTRVVRRSNALLDYGKQFHYNEVQQCDSFFAALLFFMGLAIFFVLASIRITRNQVLKRILPEPGEGPSQELRAKSSFCYNIVAQVEVIVV